MKKLVLARKDFGQNGIFGYLEDANGSFLFFTLEHAYQDANKVFLPKIAAGIYRCVRGSHTLEHHPEPFQAFEIKDVPNFQGSIVTKCLFHVGNYNSDSNGCVLLGKALGNTSHREVMLTYSKQAFENFMESMKYDEEFELEIKEPVKV